MSIIEKILSARFWIAIAITAFYGSIVYCDISTVQYLVAIGEPDKVRSAMIFDPTTHLALIGAVIWAYYTRKDRPETQS